MKCPADKSSLVIKSIVSGQTGYSCGQCSGVWLPEKYISAIKYTREFDPKLLNSLLKLLPSKESNIKCPQNCGCMLVTNLDGLEIDWCPKCSGVWFDKGELKAFLKRYPTLYSKQESDAVSGLALVEVIGGILNLFT
jgi:Zn-finger nucleic acid-binding protein